MKYFFWTVHLIHMRKAESAGALVLQKSHLKGFLGQAKTGVMRFMYVVTRVARSGNFSPNWRLFETRGDVNFSVATWLLYGSSEHWKFYIFPGPSVAPLST